MEKLEDKAVSTFSVAVHVSLPEVGRGAAFIAGT